MIAISDAARKMGLLIDDLLSFLRMSRHPVKAQQLDLDRLVRDILLKFELDLQCVEIHPLTRKGRHRNRVAARPDLRNRGVCSRQRGGVRHGLYGQAFRCIPAPAPHK